MDDDRTPLTDARHGPARLYRPDHDGHLQPVGPTIEAITGRCVEPPGRTMTWVVLPMAAGAMGGDRLVGGGQTVKLEYRVPMGSTRRARVDFDLDVFAWLGCDLTDAERWLAGHELWMGRQVRSTSPPAG